MTNVFETIYLLATSQGILLSLFLFTKKENHAANRLLGVVILALSLELASVVYYTNRWYLIYPHAMGFTYPFPFLYGPLFFLYAKLIAKKADKLRAIDLLHFLPVAAIYCITAPVFLSSGDEKIVFINNMVMHIHSPIYSVISAVLPIQGILYTILTIKIVSEYHRTIRDNYSSIDRINLSWLKYLTFGMIIIWSIVALTTLVSAFIQPLERLDTPLNFSLAVLIYAIGYMGLKQPEIFLDPSTLPTQTETAAKYQRSGLSEQSAEEIKRKLLALMTSHKPYLNKDLTLQKLAALLNTSSHNLSEVINTRMHQSYYDFINQYRIAEFKNRLADPASDRYNLLSIAYDSGFQSKGTFNLIFKKLTGMTPSEFKATLEPPAKQRSGGMD
jgi:AraC-like DNA-binding protein